jgi:hypothetical protein
MFAALNQIIMQHSECHRRIQLQGILHLQLAPQYYAARPNLYRIRAELVKTIRRQLLQVFNPFQTVTWDFVSLQSCPGFF